MKINFVLLFFIFASNANASGQAKWDALLVTVSRTKTAMDMEETTKAQEAPSRWSKFNISKEMNGEEYKYTIRGSYDPKSKKLNDVCYTITTNKNTSICYKQQYEKSFDGVKKSFGTAFSSPNYISFFKDNDPLRLSLKKNFIDLIQEYITKIEKDKS